MKKITYTLLMAALVCGLSLGITSCKDDDKDDGGKGNNPDDPERVLGPTDTEEAKAAYNWLANMTDIEDFTDDWASKTYEPTIGIESQNQTNARVVVVADIEYAKMNFSSISGIDIDQLSTTQSQTIDGVGTLTWTPSPAGASNLATVDVNTKLIPHLSQIVYCTADQVGDNGGYNGTAFYRFGDVIEDSEGYFWVCVKPAFGTGTAPQQQGYWINILNRDPTNGKNSKNQVPPIPEKNIKKSYNDLKKYNNNTILLPTELNSTKEHVHNLSNLVWALLDPQAYLDAVGDEEDGIGLGGYDYRYNGMKFIQRVAEQWSANDIWQKLFNRTYDQMKQMKQLNFFYNGYHWVRGSTAGVWIARSKGYKQKFTGSKSDDDTLFEMIEKGAGFDIRRYCSDQDQKPECASSGKPGYAPAQQFTDTEGYWVVRQKTSSQLAGTTLHPSVYATLNNTVEVYRYNVAYKKASGNATTVDTEDDIVHPINSKNLVVGHLLGRDGLFYANANDVQRATGQAPLAIVAYISDENSFADKHLHYDSKPFNCLLMALKRFTKAKWSEELYSDSCQVSVLKDYIAEPNYIMDGYDASANLFNGCGKKHDHQVFRIKYSAYDFDDKFDHNENLSQFSDTWFVPSIGQFEMALKSLGGYTWDPTNGFGPRANSSELLKSMRKKFADAGVEKEFEYLIEGNHRYWTSTLADEKNEKGQYTKACTFIFQCFLDKEHTLKYFIDDVTNEHHMLPFLAFRIVR